MKNRKTQNMVQTAALAAIVLVMSFTPLGYLRTAGLQISLLTVPVVIGAMTVGPGTGLILGLVFGFTSFYQCFGMDAFGAALLSINPFFTFLVCVPTRAFVGWATGKLFRAIRKIDKIHNVCFFAGGFLGAFLNTLLFMGVLILLFWNTDYIQNINQSMGNLNIFAFVAAFVGINAIFEMIVSCLAGGTIAKILSHVVSRQA